MNYEITESYISRTSPKLDLNPFLLLILSIVFIPAAYLYVAAVFIVNLIKGNIKTNNKHYILVYAFILIGLLSSEYKMISAIYGIIMVISFYSYQIFSSSVNLYSISKLKKSIFTVSLFVFIFGLLQYFNPSFAMPSKWVDANEYNLTKRIYSTFFNPNVFGFYINFIILLTLENLDFKKINLDNLVFISGLTCLILTFSRTAWISLIIALIAASLFNKKYIKYALIISIVILSADYFLGTGRTNLAKATKDSSFIYRFEVWKTSFEIIKDNFINGIGFGTLFKYVANYSDIVSPKIEHSHNIYIQVLTETGIIGFSIFLIIIYNIIIEIKEGLFTSYNKTWITAFAVFFMTVIHGCVDSVALTPQIMMILSIYAGTLKVIGNGS